MRFIVTRYFFIVIIHTIWIWVKACSYFCFLLKPPAVQILAVASQWVSLEAKHTWAEYYSLFSKMLLGELQSPTWTHLLCLDFYLGVCKYMKTIIWLDEWRSLYFRCMNPNYFRHISEVWNGFSGCCCCFIPHLPPPPLPPCSPSPTLSLHDVTLLLSCFRTSLLKYLLMLTMSPDDSSWRRVMALSCNKVNYPGLEMKDAVVLPFFCFLEWQCLWASSLKDASAV